MRGLLLFGTLPLLSPNCLALRFYSWTRGWSGRLVFGRYHRSLLGLWLRELPVSLQALHMSPFMATMGTCSSVIPEIIDGGIHG